MGAKNIVEVQKLCHILLGQFQHVHTYGKLASGVESHYEICCSFPQNVRSLHTLESSIFIRFLFRLCVYQILIFLPL